MIEKAKLVRLSEWRGATFGYLVVDGYPLCATLELAWKMNERDVSRIPAGEYVCRRAEKVRLRGGSLVPVTYEICDVPGRGGIYFHQGNYPKDTLGCVLLATSFGEKLGFPVVWGSGVAFGVFLERASGSFEFPLTVIDP